MKTTKINFRNSIKSTLILSLITLFFFSCNKDEFEVINGNEPIPTPQSFKNLFDMKLESLTTSLQFDASSNYTYTSINGVVLNINGSCLRKNGNPVTGIVKLSYIEIFDKGNMLTSNKPTLANVSGNKELLISGGEFFIEATQDNVKLTLTCPITLNIPTSLTGGTQTGMEPFVGTINTEGELAWDQAPTYEVLTNANASTPVYTALIPAFGWFNCDKFFDSTSPKTPIIANVPAGYGSNSAVFLAVKNLPSSLGNIYGKFPIGLDCFLIFVTEKDGKFRYVIKPQVLTANHQVTFSLSETTTATASELTAAINALQ